METEKAKLLAGAATVVGLLIIFIILCVTLRFNKPFFILSGLDFAVILAIFIWIVYKYTSADRRRVSMARRLSLQGEEIRLEYSFLRKVAGVPTKFKFEALAAATDDFSAVIGRGSSASVFKGILDDGTPVAVKRIEFGEHGDREFRSEVAAIASVQHVNLVRLLGYCIPAGGPRYLVYEFVHNGSLDNWIFSKKERSNSSYGGQRCLPWPLRYRVAIDVARALAYLHHDCRSRVLHLDVKPENILLDESFRALVADFGLSKLMNKDESRVVTTVRGTRGYLAPEWLLDTGISEKSDVYSYGMVLLELVGGRRNVRLVKEEWSYFPRIVMEKVSHGKIMEVVDKRLVEEDHRVNDLDERQVKIMVYVALWCIQEEAKLRPSMARVVEMLEGRATVEQPPETAMIIMDLLDIDGDGRLRGHAGIIPMVGSSATYSLGMSILSGR